MASLTISSDMLRRAQLEREARELRASFPEFAARAWREIDGAELVWGWFTQILAEELELWGRREPGHAKKMLCVPPRCGKTQFANIMLPAWIWTRQPSFKFLTYSSGIRLATEASRKMRTLITSPWYQERFCQEWNLDPAQHAKGHFANSARGERFSIGGSAAVTGHGGEAIIIDDAVDANPRKPITPEALEQANEAVNYLLQTRRNSIRSEDEWALMIAQRVHENDPPGMLLKQWPGEWSTVYFDSYYDPRMPNRHPKDVRTEPDEVLLPERGQTAELREKAIKTIGSDRFSAQYQQMPAQAGGMIIKPHWIQECLEIPPNLPYTIISWDCAFKGEETSSWVVGTVWKVEAPDDVNRRRFYLVDIVREHLDYASTKRAIERLAARYPETDYIVIEDKANGPAVISELRHRLPNIVAFNPNKYGDKEQRLRAVSPVFESGRVWLPKDAEWKECYINELTRFPKVSDADQVDSTTQAVIGCQYHLQEWQEAVKGKDITFFWA